MKRCAIYSRSSVDGVHGQIAFEVQETAGIELCRKNGWKYEVFREPGMPGAVLRQLMGLVKTRKFNYVFVYKLDRLSQQFEQMAAVVGEIGRSGAVIATNRVNPGMEMFVVDLLGEFTSLIADYCSRSAESSDSH